MATQSTELTANPYQSSQTAVEEKAYTYDRWMESVGIPIHRGFFIEDLRTVELGWWDERQCNAAFIQLMGQEGITSATVMEIAPGKTLPPVKFALDELIYVLQGRGVSTVWTADGGPKKTFEWQDRSLFQISSNSYLQLGNMRGDRPARLLRYSYLPLATSLVTEPSFYFNNPYQKADRFNKRSILTPRPSWSRTAILPSPGAAIASTGSATFFPTWLRGTSLLPIGAAA